MGSFKNPVTPPDPYERYRIESLEGKKPDKDRKWDGVESTDENWTIAAYFLSILNKILALFSEQSRNDLPHLENEIAMNLKSLKTAFEILKIEDRSEDIQFLNHLSVIWQQLLESDRSSFCKELIKNIQEYPENQTHSFGYYLSECAGQKWIPFPYMGLIKKIHTDHQKHPTASSLSTWISQINQLLLKAE